jgi:hypothetical protein
MKLPIALALACAPAIAVADDEIVPDEKAQQMAREANLEPERQREGLAFGFAVGPSIQMGVGDIQEASGTGGSFCLRIGTSATDRLAWFLDLFAVATPREGDTEKVKINQTSGISFGAQYMVLPAFWLRGSLGFTTLTIKTEETMSEAQEYGGLGALAGGGVDIYRLGRFALSGQLTFVTGLYKDGFVTTAIGQLGFTWY